MAKKTWAERWGSRQVDYSSKESVYSQLRKIRKLTERRLASLENHESFSFAKYQLDQILKKNYLNGRLPDIDTMTWQDRERELRWYHQFWASKTATLSGSKQEQIRQSIRLFGADKRGRPARLLTLEEGRTYWEVYNKYYELHGAESTHLDSNRVQRIIGESINTILNPDLDLVNYLKLIKYELEGEYERGTNYSDEELARHAVARDILMGKRSITFERDEDGELY